MSAGTKTERKADVLIAALLAQPTHARAAEVAGLSEATVQRWLRNSKFKARYRAARRTVLESAIGQLQNTTTEAAQALARNLYCGNPGVEVRAAVAILEQSARGLELIELSDRVELLESQLPKQPGKQ